MAAAFRKNIARFKRSKGNYTLDQIDAFFRGFLHISILPNRGQTRER